jgi:hypothetical protein
MRNAVNVDVGGSGRAAGITLIHKRSALPSVFRAWHVVLLVAASGLLLGMAAWKAVGVHDVAVALQDGRAALVRGATDRKPITRLLQQLATVGEHARTIAATYRSLSASASSGFGACDAPPADTCAAPLERFLGAVAPYPEALYFVRYVYVTAGLPRERFAAAEQTPTAARRPCAGAGEVVALTTPPGHATWAAAAPPATTMTTTSTAVATTARPASSATAAADNATMTTTTSSGPLPAPTATERWWHECGCDLVEGCFFVDGALRRTTFDPATGAVRLVQRATDLSQQDYVEGIRSLTAADSDGVWSEPREYTEQYSVGDDGAAGGNATAPPPVSELLLQFAVPFAFDPRTGACVGAASIDVSSEYIASVLAEAGNATFFFVDRLGPTLLGESSPVAANRVVRRKFNPLASDLAPYASRNVRRYMPLFRAWLGGSTEAVLPVNDSRTVVDGVSLAIRRVDARWLLFEAVGATAADSDNEYSFLRDGRLYLPVPVAVLLMTAVLLIEFVHGVFVSDGDRVDDEAEAQRRRRRRLEQQRELKRQRFFHLAGERVDAAPEYNL